LSMLLLLLLLLKEKYRNK